MLDDQVVVSRDTVSFVGDRKEFSRFVKRGMLLELVTAGFYRFWLATRIRRHLWSHTMVAGDTLEYTGTGRELLIGFFFALAILAPFYLFYFAAGLFAESLRPFASTPLVIAFYFLSQFAVFRARRYRLSRTVWRGLRFHMSGSGFGYMFRSIGWGLLVGLTLGLLLPWREAALERYKMSRTSYGSLQGAFVGTGGQLFKKAGALWLFAILVTAASITTITVYRSSAPSLGGLLIIVAVIALPFAWGAFRASYWRWKLAGIRIGPVSFSSEITAGQFYGRYWAYIGMSFLLAVVVGLTVGGLTAALQASSESVIYWLQRPLGLLALLALYVPLAMVMIYLQRLYFIHDIWQRVTRSVEIRGLQGLEAIASQGEIPSAMGESLGDSFDIGAF